MPQQINIELAHDAAGLGKQGDRVTLTVVPADMHDPEELTSYLAGYKLANMRADEVSPPIPVKNQSDKYRTFSEDDAFNDVARKGSNNGPIPEVDPKSALETYKTLPRVIGSFVPRNLPGRYDPINVALRRCKRAIGLNREIEVMALVGTNTNWDSTVRTALTSTYQWNDGSASNPIKDIMTGLEKSIQPVSDIWMNQKVAHLFIRHAEVRNHMRQMLGDEAAPKAAAAVAQAGMMPTDFFIPGLPPIHVSALKYNAAGTLSYALGDVVVFICRPPGVPTDGEEIASTYTFQYEGPEGNGYTVRQWTVENRGAYGGEMVSVTEEDDAVMTSTKAGGILTGVVQ
jgi:hypothetical protein